MRRSVQLTIIILATLLAYSNIFGNEFLIDDHAFITNWEKIRDLGNVPELVRGATPSVHEGVYRPIRSVLYAFYYQLFGTNPFGWHFHSLVVHLISTVLVYLIVSRLSHLSNLSHLGNLPAFFAALLFGLHPIHTESITYIAASMEMTGAVFFFASFYLYLRRKELGVIGEVGGVVFALLAFFTYEMTLTLPLLILLHRLLFQRRATNKSNWSNWTNWSNLVPYFAAAAFYVFVRQVIIHVPASRGEYLAYSFYHTQLTMLKVYVKYIFLLINPSNVSYLHELAPGFFSWMTKYDKLESILAQSIFDWNVLFALIVITSIILIAVFSFTRRPLVTFSIAWFFIALAPVSYIVPQGIAMGEKYLYIASFGVILIISYLGNLRHLGYLVLILALFYGYLTYQRNFDWHDPISFWGKAAIQQPKSPLAHYNVALAYGETGNVGATERHYLETIAIEPRFWEARFNLANIYLREKRADLAAQQYRTVLLLNPAFLPAQKQLEESLKLQ